MTAGPKQLFSNLRRSPRIPVDLAGMAFLAWRWSRDRQAGVAFASPGLARGAIASLMDSGLTG